MTFNKIVFILLIAIQAISFAQKSNKPAKDTLESKTSSIVVTALKYPEKMNEIPLAVSIISKNDLLNLKGAGIDEVLNNVPGVLAQSRYGNTDVRLTIRGFGARGAGDRSNAGTSRGIKLYLDGISETEPDGRTSYDLVDFSIVNNIEVIRSNASALWGNAAGGVVSLSTEPDVYKKYLNLSMQSGSYGWNKYNFNAGSPISTGMVYGSGVYSKTDGYRANSASEKILANIGFINHLSDRTKLGLFITGVSNKFNIPGPLTQTQFDSMPSMANVTYLSREERRFNRLGRIGTTLEHNFDDNNALNASAFLTSKYLQRSERNTFRDFTRYFTGGSVNYKNITEISPDIKNIALVGFDEAYQSGAILFYNLSSTNGRGAALKDNKSEGANTFGAFIQDEVTFDNISFILGARYDKISYYNQSFINNTAEDKIFEKVTPKVAISYKFNENHHIFLSYGGGVEVPAGNETDPAPYLGMDTVYSINPLLNPIVSSTIELGTRNSCYFDDSFFKRLSYEASVYMINVTNDIVPYSGGKFYFTAGKTERFGVEFGVSAELNYGLSFNGALTLFKTKYNDYKVDSVHYNKPGALADYSGKEIAGIPSAFYNLRLKYSPKILSEIYCEVSCQGVGNYYADDANRYQVPAYNVINAKIGFGKPVLNYNNLGLNLFFAINNITDQKFASSAFINPDLDGATKKPLYLEPGLPLNFVFGVSLGWF